jgi:hypothetical protein
MNIDRSVFAFAGIVILASVALALVLRRMGLRPGTAFR